jgi:hypothetical protein
VVRCNNAKRRSAHVIRLSHRRDHLELDCDRRR